MEPMIFLLSIIFIIFIFAACGRKGFRLLLSLALVLSALIFVITPLIVNGYNAEFVVFLVGLPILIAVVYLTEGFSILSHLSLIGVILNFLFVAVISHFSVVFAGLTGLTSNDTGFLGLAGINLQQLLIAGVMLSTLGILTEMVVTQIATVIEFVLTSPEADGKKIFKQSYNVGVAHLSSIINTLFLVYAGVSFPLLITYVGGHSSLYNALNFEPLVTQIIRMLTGTIGLIVAMPTSTLLAVWWFKGRLKKSSV